MKRLEAVYSAQARRDVEEQVLYFVRHASERIARAWLQSVSATADSIRAMPRRGRAWTTEDPRLVGLRFVRVIRFGRHLLFYLHDAQQLRVARVLHGSRDLEMVLDDDHPWLRPDDSGSEVREARVDAYAAASSS